MEILNSNISKFEIKQIYRRLIIKAEDEEKETSSLRRRLGELEARTSKKQKLNYAKSLLSNVITDVEEHQDVNGVSVELYYKIKRFLCE